MNYYELLEVSPNASAEVIRAAYKSLMQRYHPDKNPGDASIAERASLVVQAYEVLSDADKRADYDRRMKGAASAATASQYRASGRAAGGGAASTLQRERKDNSLFWSLLFLFAAIIVAGWAATTMLKKRLVPEPEPKAVAVQKAPAPEVAATEESDKASAPPRKEGAGKLASREFPGLTGKLSINLRNPDRPGEDSGRVLIIPAINLKVGTLDPENALRHLENTRDQLGQKLALRLSDARYEALMRSDGEQYLTKLILDIITEASGTQQAPSHSSGQSSKEPLPPGAVPVSGGTSAPADPAERYGVVEVVLPESFAVR